MSQNEFIDFLKEVAANQYLGLAGLVVSALSLTYAVYLHKRSHSAPLFKQLNGKLLSTNVIQDREVRFPKLDIYFDKEPLDNFTVTRLTLTNTGTDVIRREDVAQGDPIAFFVSDNVGMSVRILDYEIIDRSNAAANISTSDLGDGKILILFDFLEPRDHLTIQLLHTGKDSAPIVLSGTVIGAKTQLGEGGVLDPLQRQLKNPLIRAMLKFPRLVLVTVFGSGITFFTFFAYLARGTAVLSLALLIPAIFMSLLLARSVPRMLKKRTRDALHEDHLREDFIRMISSLVRIKGKSSPKEDDDENDSDK